ncbi:SdpI family protein [bacterium]|nr:MAG: SdpI family protein [bacterium]
MGGVNMAPNISIALSFLTIGLLTIALCVPLLQGKIKRNAFYGIRTPKAFESDELWFKINRYGARQMIMWSAAMVGLGVVTLFFPSADKDLLGMIFGLVVVVSLIIPTVQIFRYSKKL